MATVKGQIRCGDQTKTMYEQAIMGLGFMSGICLDSVRVNSSRRSSRAVRRRPRFVACAMIQQASVGKEPQLESEQPESLLGDFGSALEEYVQTKNVSRLKSAVDTSCSWVSPMGTFEGVEKIVEYLDGCLGWLLDSKVFITNVLDEESSLQWVASATWPYPHRPRSVVAGSSEVSFNAAGKAVRVVDEWFLKPRKVFLQVIPRLEDIWWAYGSPHCETNFGLRRATSFSGEYSIVEESSHLITEFTVDVESEEILDIADYFFVPRPPEEAFEGKIRGDGKQLVWSSLYPTKFWSRSVTEESNMSRSLRWVPRRKIALREISGHRSLEELEDEFNVLAASLERDGLINQAPAFESVLFYHYGCKHGFDSEGLLSISSFLSAPLQPVRQEIAIIIS